MGARVCRIRLDGEEAVALYRDLIAVEVCDRDDEPASFAIKLGMFLRDDGNWTLVDEGAGGEPPFKLWQRITIEAGFEENFEVLLDGYVAGFSPCFARDEADSHLLIWGYDASFAMAQEEKIVAWEDRKYSDIATELF